MTIIREPGGLQCAWNVLIEFPLAPIIKYSFSNRIIDCASASTQCPNLHLQFVHCLCTSLQIFECSAKTNTKYCDTPQSRFVFEPIGRNRTKLKLIKLMACQISNPVTFEPWPNVCSWKLVRGKSIVGAEMTFGFWFARGNRIKSPQTHY